jgi:ribosomal protein L37E
MQQEIKGTLVQCRLCETTVESQKTFACRRCGVSPFCLDHLDRELKVCSGCAAEERIRRYGDMVRQGKNVRGFLRFTQFVFMLAAMFFVSDSLFHEHLPEFLKESIFLEYVLYWGGAAVAGMVFCYIIVVSQKQKMIEVEDKIHSHKDRSRYRFR